jgi:DNA polymerase-3 subunit beta
MEFVIDKADLVRELQTVTGVVEKRSTLPILANLLLEAAGDGLLVGASDLEVTIRGRAKARVVKEGSVTLPASKLHEIARSLPDAEVKFKLQERYQVGIQCERVRYRIAGQPRDEFPNFPTIDESRGVSVPGDKLSAMIERVVFAITHEDPRYSLNGALFLLEGGTLTLVATDGHRLAYVSERLELPGETRKLRVIVPRKALAEVSKMTAGLAEGDEVRFGQSENQVFFVVGEHRLTSNVLEGTFPRYENVMPESCDIGLVVPTEELAQAVRRVSLLGVERYGRAIRLGLGAGKLELSIKTEVGEAQETLSVDYDGPEVGIGFNARYLLDFLGVVGTPSVRMELSPKKDGESADASQAGDKPGQFRPEPARDGMTYRYVVMPMHL